MRILFWFLPCLLMAAMTGKAAVVGQLINRPLDTDHPVEVSQGGQFSYDGTTFLLDDRHLLVDATLPDSFVKDQPYMFNSFAEAMEKLVDGTEEDPMTVYIAPGVYWVDDPDDPTVKVGQNGREPFGMTIRCQHLHLIGLTDDARHVVLASQRGQTQGAEGNFTMFDFHGDGLHVSYLTMGNFCNVDLDFPLDPNLGRKKRSSAITQAHVAYCHGDRVVASNVRFISRLNMNPLNGARRILFDHCHMECTDDALTGNGVYLSCDFEFYGQKPFYTTWQTGAVMLDCNFYLKGESAKSYFCKAAGALTLVDCRFHAPKEVYVGWTAYPPPTLRCYYSHLTMNGQPYVIEADHPQTSVCLDGKEALKAFKTAEGYNINGLLAGDDGWQPLGNTGGQTWTARNTAVKVGPEQLKFCGGDDPVTLTAKVLRHADYASLTSESFSWKVADGYEKYIQIKPMDDGRCILSSSYDEDVAVDVVVTATTSDGLEGATVVHLEGKPLPAPKLADKPRIVVNGHVAELDYHLFPDNHTDQSEITWYLADDKQGRNAVAVAASHDRPQRTYEIKGWDVGKYLMAAICPAHARSGKGDTCLVVSARKIRRGQTGASRMLETDFHDFVCDWQPEVREGFWTVDGYKPEDTKDYTWSFDANRPMWEYGEGFNGAVGKGLLQAQRGARIMFTPPASRYGDMEVRWDVDPTKTAGQGFGSATGQYMDVCVKFDNRTLTGYALRIIRTTKYAKAVDFMLMRYDKGTTTALTPPVSAVCYRTGCHIVVKYVGEMLSAEVTTDTPLDIPDDPALKTKVALQAVVPPNEFGGFAIQHTGSCGESTTMLHRVQATWK